MAICPECKAWIEKLIWYEKHWVRTTVSLESYGLSWEYKEDCGEVDDDDFEVECPECYKKLDLSIVGAKDLLSFCEEKTLRDECDSCKNRFNCWTE